MVRSWVGSDDATSGSVMAKLGQISAATSGSSHRRRWDSLAWACSMSESWRVKVPRANWPYSLRPWTSLT